jgi:hypothetical protein
MIPFLQEARRLSHTVAELAMLDPRGRASWQFVGSRCGQERGQHSELIAGCHGGRMAAPPGEALAPWYLDN